MVILEAIHFPLFGALINVKVQFLPFCRSGFGAACKFAQVDEGSTVAIFGLGAVGLAVILFVYISRVILLE
jgi:hypothetical protein